MPLETVLVCRVCAEGRGEEEGAEAWELRQTVRAHHLPPSPLPPPAFFLYIYTIDRWMHR